MRAIAEAERAQARLKGLQRALASEEAARDALRKKLADEDRDVEQLEKPTIRSVWDTIRGRKDDLLTAERAEADGVRLELAVRQAVVDELARDIKSSKASIRDMKWARTDLADAIAARSVALAESGGELGTQMAAVTDAVTALQHQLREVAEADKAAKAAEYAVSKAAESLESAQGWSTYDTFFGGGFIASQIKHGRLDDAAENVAGVQHSLRRLRAELEDVGVATDELVQMPSPTLRGMDVWFDNIFSDWMVHDRIKASRTQIKSARAGLADLRRDLKEHRLRLERDLADNESKRSELLSDA